MSSPQAPSDRQEVTGTVQQVIFFADRDQYGVYRFSCEGDAQEVVLVARGVQLGVGTCLVAKGRWVDHPAHGRQFEAQVLQELAPRTPQELVRRLCQYPGIGERSAQRLVDALGDEALTTLDDNPQRWLEVEGVGPKTLEQVLIFHGERRAPLAQLEDRLFEHHLPRSIARLLTQRYGNEAMGMLEHHPYRVAREVKGVGFASMDRFAMAMGMQKDAPERLEAGLLDVLVRARLDGHCALSQTQLRAKAQHRLQVDSSLVDASIQQQCASDKLYCLTVGEEPLYYEPELWELEAKVALDLFELSQVEHEPWIEQPVPTKLSAGQVQVLFAVARNAVVVMTGGPGTGKSTVVREVMEWAVANDHEVLLAAPTGRAAKRMEQATGHKAQTLHRLLEVQPESGSFRYGEHLRLPDGLVVVDEASMLDLKLFAALLSALGPRHRLLLVGDADQLPSVGAGNVLFDLIAAASSRDLAVPVVRLRQVFRQAEGSSIVQNAHRVLSGSVPQSDEGPGGEFFVMRVPSAQRVQEAVLKLVLDRIPTVYKLDPITQVQVICPMHRGLAGISALNEALSQALTGDAPSLLVKGYGGGKDQGPRRFAVGDRVMQTKNDYERNVFNGDVGTVETVDGVHQSLSVDMDGVRVRYETDDLSALRLAYAVSIHKSQGSEFPAVVIALAQEHRLMLRRNLLYTALTRAVGLCIVVAEGNALETALAQNQARTRFTGLAERIAAFR